MCALEGSVSSAVVGRGADADDNVSPVSADENCIVHVEFTVDINYNRVFVVHTCSGIEMLGKKKKERKKCVLYIRADWYFDKFCALSLWLQVEQQCLRNALIHLLPVLLLPVLLPRNVPSMICLNRRSTSPLRRR